MIKTFVSVRTAYTRCRPLRKRWKLAPITLAFIIILPSMASAMLPVPAESDKFLIGVHKIVVRAGTTLDASFLTHDHKLPAINYFEVEQAIVKQLQTTLPKSFTDKVDIEAAPINGVHPDLMEADDTLIVKFTFGYHVAKLVDKDIILGAVYSTVRRPPPTSLRSDRVSGFHQLLTGSVPPAAFVLSEDGASETVEMKNALHKSASYVVDWLNHIPLKDQKHISDQLNQSHQ